MKGACTPGQVRVRIEWDKKKMGWKLTARYGNRRDRETEKGRGSE